MATELRQHLHDELLSCELIAGSGGVFDVRLDGELIYQKSRTGRFPRPGELPGLLDQRRG